MKDWRGFEGIFHRGELPVEDLLELTEPHFSFRPTPAPEMSFFKPVHDPFRNLRGNRLDTMRFPAYEDMTGRALVRLADELERQMHGPGPGRFS